MKHDMPDHIKEFYRYKEPPKCCHTCDFYMDDGNCQIYNMTPPEEFAAQEGQCDKWQEVITF